MGIALPFSALVVPPRSLIGNANLAPWERNYGCSIYCASPYLLQLIMFPNQGGPTIMRLFADVYDDDDDS